MEYWVNIFKLGTTNLRGPDELRNVKFIIEQMQRFGHAVAFHEKYDAEGKWIEGQVTHFLTCKACLEIKLEVDRDGKIRPAEREASGLSTRAELPTESGRSEGRVSGAEAVGTGADVQLGKAAQEELRGSNLDSEYRAGSFIPALSRELRSFWPQQVPAIDGRDVLPADGALLVSSGPGSTSSLGKERKDGGAPESGVGNDERAQQRASNSGESAATGNGGIPKDEHKATRRYFRGISKLHHKFADKSAKILGQKSKKEKSNAKKRSASKKRRNRKTRK